MQCLGVLFSCRELYLLFRVECVQADKQAGVQSVEQANVATAEEELRQPQYDGIDNKYKQAVIAVWPSTVRPNSSIMESASISVSSPG